MIPLLWLDDARATDVAVTGGKGASLARLASGGFRVPPAFIVTAEAAAPLALGQRAVPGFEDAVKAALQKLGDTQVAVAVRSSGVDEDSAGRSFAGQHLTLLGVRGLPAVLEAITLCAQSVHGESAAAYRATTGRGEAAGIAVIVQLMIEPEIAGVAFSIDPVTGDESRLVVEAVEGHGISLVDGSAEADRMVIARDTLALVDQTHPGEPVLSLEVGQRVAHAVLDAERLFDQPQDIEFAFARGVLWMLQSRPVTAAGVATGDGGWVSEFDTPTSDADAWTSANVQEVLPGLLTPLTITAFQENATTAYTIGYQEIRLLKKHEWPEFVGVFYNRAFLNVGATRLVAERAIGTNGDAVEHRFLGGELKLSSRRPGSVRSITDKAISAPFLLKMTLLIKRDVDRCWRDAIEWEERARNLAYGAMPNRDLERVLGEAMSFAAETVKVHLRVSGMAGTGFEWVAGLVRPVLGDETEGTTPALFSGMRGVESAQISLDLWDLAQAANRAGVASRLSGANFDPRDPGLPGGWRPAFEKFMARHGHRGLNEMEISARSWRMDPRPVLQIVQSYTGIAPEHSPAATLDRQARERKRLTRRIGRKMNRAQRLAFNWMLGEAQKYVAMRERMKSVIVRAMRLTDFLLPEVQRRMVMQGTIEAPDDIFFVTQDELRTALSTPNLDLKAAVVRRKREYERNRYVLLPERFTGRPVPMAPEAHAEGTSQLTGTPVSPGLVTARARVILDPRTDAPIEPGEILVAPVTDAGWTPLFALASGLVVDMGSALSHGSTVAREYGLPAVVNVRGATRIIRTGDLLTVDGAKGTVTVVPADETGEQVPGAGR